MTMIFGTTGIFRTTSAAIAALALFATAGCQQASEPDNIATAAEPAGLTKLPISINATMVSTISASADFLFAVGNGDLPRNAQDWKQVEYHAYQMILGGQIMKVPGTGENDAGWVASPVWVQYSDQLTQIGMEALELAKAENADAGRWQTLGSSLVDNCEGCHASFKPDIPSQGILHQGGKRESEGKSIFD